MGQFKDIISPKASLVVFYTGLMLIDSPIAELRNIAAYFGPDVDIFKVENSDNVELCRRKNITSELTYFIYSNSEQIDRMDGYTEESLLKNKLLNLLNTLKIS